MHGPAHIKLLSIVNNFFFTIWTDFRGRGERRVTCGRSLAGITGSNTDGGMNVCFLWLLCVVRWRSLRRADHPSREVLQNMVCLWSRSLANEEGLAPQGAVGQCKKKLSHLGEINYTTKVHAVTCQCRQTIGQLLLYQVTSSTLEKGTWLTLGPDCSLPGGSPSVHCAGGWGNNV